MAPAVVVMEAMRVWERDTARVVEGGLAFTDHLSLCANTRTVAARVLPIIIVETLTIRPRYPDGSPGCLLAGFPY